MYHTCLSEQVTGDDSKQEDTLVHPKLGLLDQVQEFGHYLPVEQSNCEQYFHI